MVKVSQIKVPVVDVIKASGGKGIKNGIITEADGDGRVCRYGNFCQSFYKSGTLDI